MKKLNKVPEVTLSFWATKIAATTLGETGGDTLSMSLDWGYALSTLAFFTFFVIMMTMQVRANSFRPFLYWATIVATTTVGTTMADFADRSLGIGYVGGSILLFVLLAITLAAWRTALGSISVSSINTPKAETFYWFAVLFSNTLGTALGDFVADNSGLGYGGAAIVFASALAVLALAYCFMDVSHTLLFWAGFILTRPLGATVGDVLTKPYSHGGLALDRLSSTAVITLVMVILVYFTSRRSAEQGDAELEEPRANRAV